MVTEDEPIYYIDCECDPRFDRLLLDCVHLPPGREVRARMPDGTWEMRAVRVVEPGSGIGIVDLREGEDLESVCVDEEAPGTLDYCKVSIRLEDTMTERIYIEHESKLKYYIDLGRTEPVSKPWIGNLLVKELDSETVRVRFDIPVDFFYNKDDAEFLMAHLTERLHEALDPSCTGCGERGFPLTHHPPMLSDIKYCSECLPDGD